MTEKILFRWAEVARVEKSALRLRPLDSVPSLGAPHLDFEMWESTNSMKLLRPVRVLERNSHSNVAKNAA
jgi:hypothetical protein